MQRAYIDSCLRHLGVHRQRRLLEPELVEHRDGALPQNDPRTAEHGDLVGFDASTEQPPEPRLQRRRCIATLSSNDFRFGPAQKRDRTPVLGQPVKRFKALGR